MPALTQQNRDGLVVMEEPFATALRHVTCRDCSDRIRVRVAIGTWGFASGLGACFCEPCLRKRVQGVKAARRVSRRPVRS